MRRAVGHGPSRDELEPASARPARRRDRGNMSLFTAFRIVFRYRICAVFITSMMLIMVFRLWQIWQMSGESEFAKYMLVIDKIRFYRTWGLKRIGPDC